jgi:hypothetical protein
LLLDGLNPSPHAGRFQWFVEAGASVAFHGCDFLKPDGDAGVYHLAARVVSLVSLVTCRFKGKLMAVFSFYLTLMTCISTKVAPLVECSLSSTCSLHDIQLQG